MMNIEDIKKFFLAAISFSTVLAASCASSNDTASAELEIQPATKLAEITFVAFDTETTGFSPEANRILEIGAVKFRDGEIIGRREWLVDPGSKIPYFATRAHGITDEMVAGKPGFAEIYPEFARFAEGAVLIAHNSRFDRDFMRAEMERAGIDSGNMPLLDSLKLFRKMLPDAPSHSIGRLVRYLRIDPADFHRALIDSVYIVRIFEKAVVRSGQDLDYADLLEYNGGPDRL